MSETPGSVYESEVLVIGGGFSAMPLLRELDESGVSYKIISEMAPVWKQLEDEDALDFDLVSSLQSSVYSHELVEMMEEQGEGFKDVFPTAREFYAIQKKYAARYAGKTHCGRVRDIDNHADHSLVNLESGETYRANHVIIATAFRRKMNEALKQVKIDESYEGQSVAITSTGDSANLIIAKLVAYGAKVHLVTHGFLALDKIIFYYTPEHDHPHFVPLDQWECPNMRETSIWTYRAFIDAGYIHGMNNRTLAKLVDRYSMAVRHPLSIRKDFRNFFIGRASGHIAIKHWPIDIFRAFCGDNLEERIREGYLMNDLPFFVEHGHVKLWDKATARIDRNAMLLEDSGQSVPIDEVIDGDSEIPNIPPVYQSGQSRQPYKYNVRNHLFGVVSPKMKNIYTIGFVRPFTGGLNNISEMQCLLVHRLITDQSFRSDVMGNLDQLIADYNKTQYADRPEKVTDHVVFYGAFTDKIAKLLGIRPEKKDAKSLFDLVKYYLFPNNVFYFRENGRYKVDGISKMIKRTARDYQNYRVLFLVYVRIPLFELLALGTIALAPIAWWLKIPAMLAHLYLPFTSLLLAKFGLQTRKGRTYFAYRLLTTLPVAVYPLILPPVLIFGGMNAGFWFSAGLLVYAYAAINLGCALGWNRRPFCDLRSKRAPENISFFEKYQALFRRVKAKPRKKAKEKSFAKNRT